MQMTNTHNTLNLVRENLKMFEKSIMYRKIYSLNLKQKPKNVDDQTHLQQSKYINIHHKLLEKNSLKIKIVMAMFKCFINV